MPNIARRSPLLFPTPRFTKCDITVSPQYIPSSVHLEEGICSSLFFQNQKWSPDSHSSLHIGTQHSNICHQSLDNDFYINMPSGAWKVHNSFEHNIFTPKRLCPSFIQKLHNFTLTFFPNNFNKVYTRWHAHTHTHTQPLQTQGSRRIFLKMIMAATGAVGVWKGSTFLLFLSEYPQLVISFSMLLLGSNRPFFRLQLTN